MFFFKFLAKWASGMALQSSNEKPFVDGLTDNIPSQHKGSASSDFSRNTITNSAS
jgi:hypothetical protein